MKKVGKVLWIVLLSVLWCAGRAESQPSAEAVLVPTSGSTVQGRVFFVQRKKEVSVQVEAMGFAPNSVHGFHVHAVGDCSAPDATSSGGHFAPYNHPHGHPYYGPHHAGDMPNLVADAQGRVHAYFLLQDISLYNDRVQNVVGLSVVVHASRDNYYSQPAGDSGPRIACGEIVRK